MFRPPMVSYEVSSPTFNSQTLNIGGSAGSEPIGDRVNHPLGNTYQPSNDVVFISSIKSVNENFAIPNKYVKY